MRKTCAFRVFTILLLVLGPFPLASGAAYATVIPVDTFLDDLDINGNCTLREAVIAANTNAARDACPAGSGTDTIQLPAGVYSFSISGRFEDAALEGDLDLTASLTIQGAGMESTVIDANALDRVFQIFAPAQVILNDLTIRNGDTSLGLGPLYSGGGISLISGSQLTLSNVTIDSNTAGDSGGGIYNNAGTATLNHVMLSQNSSGYYGGAIRNLGTLNIYNTAVASNQAANAGGGIHSSFILNMNASTVNGNMAATNGGGLYLSLGTATLTNVTMSGNTASATQGGGIWVYYQTEITLTNTTITGNYAGQGGGIFNNHQQARAAVEASAVPLALQAVGNVHMKNTIVAGNTLINCGRSTQTEPIHTLGHNLDSGDTCEFLPTLGDLENTNPQMGLLQDNGGPTLTHALLPGSPAIDVGDNADCPATDQRGVSRPQGSACDIGAYESIPSGEANLGISKGDDPDPVEPGRALTYTLSITNTGPNEATSVEVVDTLPAGVEFRDAAGSGWSCGHTAGTVTCTRPSLAVGSAPDITIAVLAPASPGTITNTATVTSTVTDPSPWDNTASISTQVRLVHHIYLPLAVRQTPPGSRLWWGP